MNPTNNSQSEVFARPAILIPRIGGIAKLVAAVALLSYTSVTAQVVVTPNQIVGTIGFSNTDPDVLAILNSALPIKQISFEAISIGVVPPLQAFGGLNNPDTPTGTAYQFSVDTSDAGIPYQVLPRYVRLSAPDGVLGSQTYTFVPKDSAPVFPEPAPDVVLNFSECVAILDVQWVDESGDPVAISGGRMGGLSEHPPGSGLFQYSDASGQTGVLLPSGISQQYHALRGGEKWKFYVYTQVGSDPFSDLTVFASEFIVDAVCDTMVPIRVVVPTPGGFGRIIGRADVVGEDEHLIGPQLLSRVGADGGPFYQRRFDHLAFNPSQGSFALENLLPSDAVSPEEPYTVWADFAFRTGHRFARLQTPFLSGRIEPNAGVFVHAGETVDLGDTFVIHPGYIRGRLTLAGNVIRDLDLPGNSTDGNGVPLEWNSPYDVYSLRWHADPSWFGSAIQAFGFPALLPGDTSAYGGIGQSFFDSVYNPTSDAYEGNYELVLGGLNGDTTMWRMNRLWLHLLNKSTPEVQESYRDEIVIITDNLNTDRTIVPGETVTIDRQYCFSEVRVHFQSTSGNLYNPALIYWGGFVGTDFLGQPADYQVSTYPPSYAVGTPTVQHLAAPEALVVIGLPQGDYTLQPQTTVVDGSGVASYLVLSQFGLNVGCRQVIDLTPELQVNLNPIPACVNQPTLNVSGSVNSSLEVTRVFYTIDNGPEVDVCTGCGVDPALSFPVTLANCANELKVTAVDAGGHEASVTSTVTFDIQPPVISGCNDIAVDVEPNETGAIVSFSITAADNCPDPVSVNCVPPSGSFFPVGETTVTCTATDACGNTSQCQFVVHVDASDPPLDPTFGICGKVITDVSAVPDLAPPQRVDTRLHIAIQSDGKIVIGFPNQDDGTGRRFALLRYNSDGSLDPTFGTSGIALMDFPGFIGGSMTLDRNGKVVLAGYAPQPGTGLDWVIGRRNLDGSADTSFDGDGWAVVDLGGDDYVDQGHGIQARLVAVDSQNRIVVKGRRLKDGGGQNSLVRLNPDGSLDTSFDGDGKLIHFFSYDGFAMTLDPSDQILVAGYVDAPHDFFLYRLNLDGSFDSTFGIDGKVRLDFADRADIAGFITVDGNGRIVVAGWSGGITAIARLDSSGNLDTTFDGDGKVDLAFDSPTSMALDSSNRIVIGGNTTSGGVDFTAFRFRENGTLDPSFGGNGTARIGFCGSSYELTYDVAIDSQNNVVLPGKMTTGPSAVAIAMTRILSGDSPLPPTRCTPPPPTITCPAGIVVTANAEGQAVIPDLRSQAILSGVTPCNPAAVSQSPAPATLVGCGPHTVTLTLNDSEGHNISCTTIVTVVCNREPVARCKSVTVSAGANCSANADINDGSYDPDAGNTITLNQSPAGPYPLGETVVTLTVTDNHGASSQCTATVTVVDNTPPNFSCPPDVTVAFNALPPPTTTATDNCDPNPAVTFVDSTAGVCPMIVTRTYTARDASGNVTTCQQNITVNNLFAGDGIIWHQPLARNGASEDTDPSAGGTLKYRFKLGSTIPIKVHAVGCGGSAVTGNANVIGTVQVFGDTNCDGVADGSPVPIDFNGVGEGGGVMDKIGGHLMFNLDTKKLPQTAQCYLLQVTVTDTSTGESRSEIVPLQTK